MSDYVVMAYEAVCLNLQRKILETRLSKLRQEKKGIDRLIGNLLQLEKKHSCCPETRLKVMEVESGMSYYCPECGEVLKHESW